MIKQAKARSALSGATVMLALFPWLFQPAAFPDDLDLDEKSDRTAKTSVQSGEKIPDLYPLTLDQRPEIPSPFVLDDGTEIVTVFTKDERYALVPVTVENGEPYEYARHGKGKQLAVDAADFPSLASTGLHSEQELDQTLTITGRSVDEITALGRPGQASGEGFLAPDEDIISVLKADNRIVKSLGLTHKDLARALFHMWNLILENTVAYRAEIRPYGDVAAFLYHGKKIHFQEWYPTKGWQESIFDDEIYGGYHIHVYRDLNEPEQSFLKKRYAHLTLDQLGELEKRLTRFHTGEMEPYYVMRYGFYEGHTDYRVDPIALAFIFGLKSLEELEAAFPGRLYEVLTTHFTREQHSDSRLK
jgi:hypothetical protein